MDPRDDSFQPKCVDEQIEWLAQRVQEGTHERNQSARLVQRLQDYYVRKRQRDALNQAWKSIAQRYEASALVSSEEWRVQNEQRKLERLGQYRMQQNRAEMMPEKRTQKNAIQMVSQRETGWRRRLSAFAAILCTIVLVGGLVTVLNAVRANRTTTVGSQVVETPALQQTPHPTSSAISKAILTDSLSGNSEGIGPGLAGITGTTQLTVGRKFWVVFLLTDDSGGTVTVKWYANNRLYSSSSRYQLPLSTATSQPSPAPTPSRNSPVRPDTPIESSFSITYGQPAEGKVELYWKGQLAMTLPFVVKP
jgi:hypothetical protein